MTTSRHQKNSVLFLQLNVYIATGCDETLLLGGECVQNPLSVMEQIQTGVVAVHGGVEAELVHAWSLARKISCLCVITVLSVVDDIFESNGLVSFREVVAQSHREGNFSSSAGSFRRTLGNTWSSGHCEGKNKHVHPKNPDIAVLKYYLKCFCSILPALSPSAPERDQRGQEVYTNPSNNRIRQDL